jgi:2-keto-4-pentenoate hydratase/2-oxohepta-3-ene-1,7-dioic acid hydratase in catechol pathway
MAATIFEGEAELAVVIGKRASHVKATNAMSYVLPQTIDAQSVSPAWEARARTDAIARPLTTCGCMPCALQTH